MICNAKVDLGYEVNMFNMLSGNANNFASLGCFRRYDPTIDRHYVRLEDLPRKITWTTFFDPSYDFSKAIDKVQRVPILFGVVFIIAFYLLFSKLWSQEFDKLLRALTVFDLKGYVLTM